MPSSVVSAAAAGGLSVVSAAAFDWGKFEDAIAFLFNSVSVLQEFDVAAAVGHTSPSLIVTAMQRLWTSVRETEQAFLKV